VDGRAAVEWRRVLDAAPGFGGAEATRRRGPDWLQAEMAVAGLRGRGRAAFPLWTKREAALAQPAPGWWWSTAPRTNPGA
jgi:NADH:ubiquinone oxidoreductase subunit F (NADH-binding)